MEKRNFLIEFGILDEERLCATQNAPFRGLVTIQNWSDSEMFL